MPPPQVAALPPPGWQAPLPHGGSLADLSSWWTRLEDPVLVELIAAAEAASGSLATARSRIAQARSTRVGAGAALGPTLDANAQASRGFSEQTLSVATVLRGTLQASWEADVFGGNRATRDAAEARLRGAEAQWHEARVSVAAETADRYDALRNCEAMVTVLRQDAASRTETARLTDLTSGAGFESPANAELARASAADASARLTQQRAQCDVAVKALVALTAMTEPDLRARLAGRPARFAEHAFTVPAVPAQMLAQRPDVYAAEREVAAASFEVGAAEAERYPSLRLSGSIGSGQVRSGGVSVTSQTWSIGPLELSLPLYDGGRRRAEVDAARVRYDEAVTLYRERVRNAVSEVEQALVNLQAAGERAGDAQRAAAGYRAAFEAAETRYRSGLGSLIDMEDVRRTALNAEMTLTSLDRERSAAWISLYRAMGGGWSRPADASPTLPDAAPSEVGLGPASAPSTSATPG